MINGKSYTYAIENWLKMQGIPSTWLEGENLLTKFLPLGLMLARMLSIERLIDVEDPLGLKGLVLMIKFIVVRTIKRSKNYRLV